MIIVNTCNFEHTTSETKLHFSVENWEQCEAMLDYIYTKCLSVDSAEHPAMMSEVAVSLSFSLVNENTYRLKLC